MPERKPQPAEELLGLRKDLHDTIADFSKHFAERHPSGIIPTSCHRCIVLKAAIQGQEELIKRWEVKIEAANTPRKITRRTS